MERLLLVHEHADAWLPRLRRRFPDLEVRTCTEATVLPRLIAAFRPTIAYSCKTSGMPGPTHRPLLDAPDLVWLHVGGSGYDHLAGWEERSFVLTNSRGVLAPYLAETLMGALLALVSGLRRHLRQQEAGIWRPNPWRPLAGRTMLLIGTGAIAREVARRARPFGVRVIGLNRTVRDLPEFDEVRPLHALRASLAEADIVSLHLRLTAETRHLIDRSVLSAMREGTLFLNTARGGLVDETALVEALEQGHLAGAYLDVFEEEPLPRESLLWRLDNVILTPHAADQIADWEDRFADFFMDNLERRLDGRPLLNVVAAETAPGPSA
ncbi:D-2-hydroxyacid dehydrogenase [Benzoatithermus flavus]|uniref:D-2-hydroxyacid dehydrogenase n=1 Tax=Benzoatithermus flavus TaxID=3108223 RepID=A0ABU8XQI2_9PROT